MAIVGIEENARDLLLDCTDDTAVLVSPGSNSTYKDAMVLA
jgi:hypothetical protein